MVAHLAIELEPGRASFFDPGQYLALAVRV